MKTINVVELPPFAREIARMWDRTEVILTDDDICIGTMGCDPHQVRVNLANCEREQVQQDALKEAKKGLSKATLTNGQRTLLHTAKGRYVAYLSGHMYVRCGLDFHLACSTLSCGTCDGACCECCEIATTFCGKDCGY